MVFEGNLCIRSCAGIDVVSDETMVEGGIGLLKLFQKGKIRCRLLLLKIGTLQNVLTTSHFQQL